MITPKTSMRTLKIEDNPDPIQSSSYYSRHFEYFDLQPEGKTIRQVVFDFRERVGEIFIRHCHLEPDTYDFNDFRLTRTYKLQRELNTYLLGLSSWLYRGKKFPPSLKRSFRKWSSFKNPYKDLNLPSPTRTYLATLDLVQLSVFYNYKYSSEDFFLHALITEEYEKRGVNISCLKQYPKPPKIEVIKEGKGYKLRIIQSLF